MPDLTSAFNALAPAANALLGDALAPYALFSSQGRVIGTIAVDVPLREVHSDTFVPTQHPVEGGTPVSDHYYSNPSQLEMTCGYSDSTAGYQGYSQQVYAAFIALAKTRQPFSDSTGKRLYDNLMFAEISVITDPTSEYALFLTARLQEVIITSSVDGLTAGMTQANQAFPGETSPTVNGGYQSLQPAAIGSDAKFATAIPSLTPAGTGGIGRN